MNLLLLSASREGDTGYLEHAQPMLASHLEGIDEVLFIPYAGVSISYDEYTQMVGNAFSALGIKVVGIHDTPNPQQAVAQAKAVAVGGGNTFHLLHQLYEHKLVDAIRERVASGMPYVGWSAGSNVAGNSIRTTNDMPIIQPPSFEALNLVPFQINPHYTDYQAPGHNGETREQRLQEFMVINPQMPIVGIQEGSAIKRDAMGLRLEGEKTGFLFKAGEKQELAKDADLSALL